MCSRRTRPTLSTFRLSERWLAGSGFGRARGTAVKTYLSLVERVWPCAAKGMSWVLSLPLCTPRECSQILLRRVLRMSRLTFSRARKYLRNKDVSSCWRWNEVSSRSIACPYCLLVFCGVQPGSSLVRKAHHSKKTGERADDHHLRAS